MKLETLVALEAAPSTFEAPRSAVGGRRAFDPTPAAVDRVAVHIGLAPVAFRGVDIVVAISPLRLAAHEAALPVHTCWLGVPLRRLARALVVPPTTVARIVPFFPSICTGMHAAHNLQYSTVRKLQIHH